MKDRPRSNAVDVACVRAKETAIQVSGLVLVRAGGMTTRAVSTSPHAQQMWGGGSENCSPVGGERGACAGGGGGGQANCNDVAAGVAVAVATKFDSFRQQPLRPPQLLRHESVDFKFQMDLGVLQCELHGNGLKYWFLADGAETADLLEAVREPRPSRLNGVRVHCRAVGHWTASKTAGSVEYSRALR